MSNEFNKFKCPYCFEELEHDKVHFRSETVYNDEKELMLELTNNRCGSREALEMEFSMYFSPDELKEIIKEYDKKKIFFKGMSSLYKRFWRRFKRETEPDTPDDTKVKNQKERPILTPEQGKLIYDEDGFVNGLLDDCNEETIQRVCSHCHNPLPLNYGKYDAKYISVIGTQGAGKTVFLSQFLNDIEDEIAKVGLAGFSLSDAEKLYVKRNQVKKDTELPLGTEPGNLEQPLFYDIQGKNERMTFVFYDIAGKDCVTVGNMRNYSKFVKYSNGIIFLIDPRQMQVFSLPNDDRKELEKPMEVLDTVRKAFPGGIKTDVPLAVVISKSDECRRELQRCSTIYQPRITKVCELSEANNNPQFNAKEYNKIAEFLRQFIEKNEPGALQVINKSYKNYNFFAFSAIGGDTADRKPTSDPLPYRIYEPFYWILNKLGILGANDSVYHKISKADADKEMQEFADTLEKPDVFHRTYITELGHKISIWDKDKYDRKRAEIYANVDDQLKDELGV